MAWPGADASADARASTLSRRLNLPYLNEPPGQGIVLAIDDDGAALRDAGRRRTRALRATFSGPEIDRRLQGGRRSSLARALGLHRRPRQSVFDATCGLGRDAAVLLGLGCEVQAAERHPVMRLLLEDAIERARHACPERLTHWRGLVAQDATSWLRGRPGIVAEVIYLDPMFGSDGRRALPKAEMQTLAGVVGGDSDDAELLMIARTRASRRVVVKKHRRAAALASPDHSVATRGARFDIYLSKGDADFK